jgi:hypothetical protein
MTLAQPLARDQVGDRDIPPSSHPVIATIRIDRSDVFEESDEDQGHFPYRLANRLHIETREHIIRRELLFTEGSPADPDVLYESERNLRRLSYLHDNAQIEAVPRPDGMVDVVVRVRDIWTTRPEISLKHEGGTTTGRLSFVEGNVLGFGKTAGVSFRKELDRNSGGVLYRDPRLLGTRWTLQAEYFDRSDGLTYLLDARRPFYSLLTRDAGGAAGSHFSQVTTLQKDGDDEPGFRQRHTEVQVHAGRALRAGYDRVGRIVWRLKIEDDRFDLEPGEAPLADPQQCPVGGAGCASLPADRRHRILEAEYQSLDVDFVKARFLDKFDRTQDVNLGRDWAVSFGISPRALGDDHSRIFFSGRYERWFRPSAASFSRARAFTSGRFLAGAGQNVITGLDLTHYYLGLPRQTVVLHLGQTWGHNLDLDRQLLLGAESGLRGYDNRRFDGNKSLLFNAEDRVYLVFDWLRLLSIGLAGFADAGYVWRAGDGQDLGDLVADVGVGLRFDLTRGSTGTIIRLDYAYPVSRIGKEENPSGILSFSTGQAF